MQSCPARRPRHAGRRQPAPGITSPCSMPTSHREIAKRSWQSRPVRISWISSRPWALAMTTYSWLTFRDGWYASATRPRASYGTEGSRPVSDRRRSGPSRSQARDGKSDALGGRPSAASGMGRVPAARDTPSRACIGIIEEAGHRFARGGGRADLPPQGSGTRGRAVCAGAPVSSRVLRRRRAGRFCHDQAWAQPSPPWHCRAPLRESTGSDPPAGVSGPLRARAARARRGRLRSGNRGAARRRRAASRARCRRLRDCRPPRAWKARGGVAARRRGLVAQLVRAHA